jgi:exopolysaccharide biosynthesis protein
VIRFIKNLFGRTVVTRACLLVIALPAATARAADGDTVSTNQPLPGITIRIETRKNPPTRLFIAEVDLTDPRIHLHVAQGGPDPDGSGAWQTTLMEPSRVAARENFDLVVNGDFFKARGVHDAEGADSQFRANLWACVEGPAVSNGKIWSTSVSRLPCLVVHKNQTVTIETVGRPTSDDLEVVAGNTLLLKDDAITSHFSNIRHPRTVLGLNAAGTRLTILVVDGRKPDAIGMNYTELAMEMRRLGCAQALNLDGGGSSVMALRDPDTGKFRLLNQPTDGRERAVANVFGISVDRHKSK